MMSSFSTLRQSSDRKESRDSAAAAADGDDDFNHANRGDDSIRDPLSLRPLLRHDNRDGKLLDESDDDDDDRDHNTKFYTLRIKLNDGGSSDAHDFALHGVCTELETVGGLKDRILRRHYEAGRVAGGSSDEKGGGDHHNDHNNNNNNNDHSKNRYLRLIFRGRMMAPDSAALSAFQISDRDVVHAVLAKEGVRGGQQARMLRRLNGGGQVQGCSSGARNGHHTGGNQSRGAPRGMIGGNGGGSGGLVSSFVPSSGLFGGEQPSHAAEEIVDAAHDGGGRGLTNRARRLWRGIGIDANGVVISPSSNDDDDDDDEGDSEWDEEDDDGEEGVAEVGSEEDVVNVTGTNSHNGDLDLEMGGLGGSNAVSDQSAQQQHQEQQSRRNGNRRTRRGNGRRGGRPRERRGFDRLRSTGMSRDEVTALRLYFSRSIDRYIERRRVIIRAANRLRSSLNDFSSRVVPSGSADENGATAAASQNDESGDALVDGGDSNSATANNSRSAIQRIGALPLEGEEILNDRRRMEDEWMAIQGPYSEFRMNLNTNNPLLLAAISGGTAPDDPLSSMPSGAAGLFLRRGASNANNSNGIGGINLEDDDDDDLMFGGSVGPNGRFHHSYMGPLPSAGTDKDFVWGFILGFFVGYIMLFWVWMPTVPHKQKIGIISGISFHSGLNLLRKSGQVGDVH